MLLRKIYLYLRGIWVSRARTDNFNYMCLGSVVGSRRNRCNNRNFFRLKSNDLLISKSVRNKVNSNIKTIIVILKKPSPKEVSASKCDIGNWMFQNLRNFLRNCLEIFWIFHEIFYGFFGKFYGFFGRLLVSNFLEQFF